MVNEPIPSIGKEIRKFKKEETREQLVDRVRQEIQNLFTVEGRDIRPTVKEYGEYQGLVSDEYYANKSQARESDHNIEHAASVWALSLAMQNYLAGTSNRIHYDRDALAIGAFLHDSQRMDDVKESVFDLQGHGKRAAVYVQENKTLLSSLLGRSLSYETLEKAQRVCEFHDNEYRTKDNGNNDELVVVAGADRATLPRILFSYHTIVASLGKLAGIYQGIVWRRATRYEIKDHKDLVKTFLPIGTLLCLLAREEVGDNFDLNHQFDSVKKAAMQLGLFKQ